MGLDPDDPWIGGYVDYEWTRSRHAFTAGASSVHGRDVLEFGCHVGGTAMVLAALGARVTAVDVDASCLLVARANAERYGMTDAVAFHHVSDTRALPFADEAFDVISCNSVLEYVHPDLLAGVQRELDRVLRPGGVIVILGTSNRVWPRELHSGALGINYVPRPLFQRITRRLVRGVSPWRLRHGFGGYEDLSVEDGGAAYVAMKTNMGIGRSKRALLAAGSAGLASLGVSFGMLTPSISLFLRKQPPAPRPRGEASTRRPSPPDAPP